MLLPNATILLFCPLGFGVCCQRTATDCGSKVSGNCTYIQNKEFPKRTQEAQSGCSYDIMRMSENICFIRLDFDKFEVALPEVPELGVKGECKMDEVTFTCVEAIQLVFRTMSTA